MGKQGSERGSDLTNVTKKVVEPRFTPNLTIAMLFNPCHLHVFMKTHENGHHERKVTSTVKLTSILNGVGGA